MHYAFKKIISLLLFACALSQAEPVNETLFRCSNPKINISVMQQGKDLRYTAWSKSPAQPDLEIHNGKATTEGSGVCAYARYRFSGCNGCLKGKS